MKLKKFTKNKKQKGIVMGSIVGILLLIGGITLYRTFAMYKIEQSFNVLNGTVPDFSSGDIQLAITVDGKKEETIPTKSDKYGVVVSCDNAKGSWDKDQWRVILEQFTGSKVKCNLYFESTLSGYIKALSKVDASIIEEKHDKTEQTPELTDYRYVGANPNNYVCLEENGSCDDNNLYRIIGVIPTQKEEDANSQYEDRVKLIKNTSYGNYPFSNIDHNNDWTKSTLNTQVLNNEYWTSINSYQKYIEKAKWYLGSSFRTSAKDFYKNERSNQPAYDANTTDINTIEKIALIYPSDYMYATSGGGVKSREICLNTIIGVETWGAEEYSNCKNNDWLYNGEYSFTLTSSNYEPNQLAIYYNGIVGYVELKSNSNKPTYPSFYLKKDVLYKSGDGTHENPYRISINEN